MSLDAPGAMVALVDDVYVLDGHVVVDCSTEDGAFWTQVPLATVGGGKRTWGVEPVEPPESGHGELARDRGQVLLVLRGPYVKPLAIGMLPADGGEVVEDAPVVDQQEDHPGVIGKADFARVNGGARLIVDEHGAITLDAREAGDATVRVQLADGGVLRVSRGGEATERLPLAGPLLDHLKAINDYLAAVDTWIQALAVDPTTHKAITPFFGQVPTLVPDAIRAAAVHVSERSEADG